MCPVAWWMFHNNNIRFCYLIFRGRIFFFNYYYFEEKCLLSLWGWLLRLLSYTGVSDFSAFLSFIGCFGIFLSLWSWINYNYFFLTCFHNLMAAGALEQKWGCLSLLTALYRLAKLYSSVWPSENAELYSTCFGNKCSFPNFYVLPVLHYHKVPSHVIESLLDEKLCYWK